MPNFPGARRQQFDCPVVSDRVFQLIRDVFSTENSFNGFFLLYRLNGIILLNLFLEWVVLQHFMKILNITDFLPNRVCWKQDIMFFFYIITFRGVYY